MPIPPVADRGYYRISHVLPVPHEEYEMAVKAGLARYAVNREGEQYYCLERRMDVRHEDGSAIYVTVLQRFRVTPQ